MSSRRRTWFALVVLVLAAHLSQSPAQPPRRELRVGVTGLGTEIDPGIALRGPVALVARQVFDTLVAYAPGSTDVEPSLATRWAVSRDGLTWTFTLRDNARFHDGAPLGAGEVAASFSRQLAAETPAGAPARVAWSALLRGVPGVVREVRAADARTVEIVLAQPYAPLLTVLAHPGLAVTRSVTGSDGVSRAVGSGLYRVAEVAPGRVVLEAAGNAWGGPPRTERIVFLDMPGDERGEAELDAGGIDVWLPSGPPRRLDGSLSVPGLRVGYLAFQTEKEPFARKKVRQAVAAAIDPAALGAALDRVAVPMQAFLPPGVWGRREGTPILGGHREAARKLLAEAGGVRGLRPTMLVPSTDVAPLDLTRVGEVIQAALAAADLHVQLRIEPAAAARAAAQAGDHDLVLSEAVVAGGDPHLFLFPLSTTEGARKGPAARNFSFYRNPRVDDLLIRASQIGFRPERQRLYHRAQSLLAEELPWVPLYTRLEWALARPDVRGLRLHPTGIHRLDTVVVDGTR